MPPHLGIRHLRMLVIISRHKTLTAAANTLGLSPSALSHRIREAEHRLNVKLVERGKGKLHFTSAGKILFETAKNILPELEHAEEKAKNTHLGKEHIVRIGIWANTCPSWLPIFLTDFDKKTTDIGFELSNEASLRPVEALREGTIDIAIISGNPPAGEFERHHLYEDELVALLNIKHPKANNEYIEASEFSEDTYITYSIERIKGHEYDLLFQKHKINPFRFIKVNTLDTVVELISSGLGVSILAKSSLPSASILKSKGIMLVPLTQNGIFIDWHILNRKADNEPEAVKRLNREMILWLKNNPSR